MPRPKNPELPWRQHTELRLAYSADDLPRPLLTRACDIWECAMALGKESSALVSLETMEQISSVPVRTLSKYRKSLPAFVRLNEVRGTVYRLVRAAAIVELSVMEAIENPSEEMVRYLIGVYCSPGDLSDPRYLREKVLEIEEQCAQLREQLREFESNVLAAVNAEAQPLVSRRIPPLGMGFGPAENGWFSWAPNRVFKYPDVKVHSFKIYKSIKADAGGFIPADELEGIEGPGWVDLFVRIEDIGDRANNLWLQMTDDENVVWARCDVSKEKIGSHIFWLRNVHVPARTGRMHVDLYLDGEMVSTRRLCVSGHLDEARDRMLAVERVENSWMEAVLCVLGFRGRKGQKAFFASRFGKLVSMRRHQLAIGCGGILDY